MTAQAKPAYAPTEEEPIGQTPSRRMTVAEYLELEYASEMRHEYRDGVIIDMAGGSPIHDRLSGNCYVLLENAFRDRSCNTYTSNMRVRVSQTQYRYPDVSATSGEPAFSDERPPALLNPSLISEVLSPSNSDEDREDKYVEYKRIRSLLDYVLIEQDRIEVTHFARQSPTRWLVTVCSSVSDTVSLKSVGVDLAVADLYRKTPHLDPPPTADSAS